MGAPLNILTNLRSPNDPWVATKKLDGRIAEAFKNGLLSLHDTNVLTALHYKLIGFQAVQPADYNALDEAIDRAQLFDQRH
jgi:ABC-type phosphate/phosphonate transport system substrate-binding protein